MSRKIRSDAVLLNLPEERQEQIWEWCRKPSEKDGDGNTIPGTGGFAHARAQLAADGLKVSLRSLSSFFSVYRLKLDMETVENIREAVETQTGDARLARTTAETVFMNIAIARQDPKTFAVAAKAQDSRESLRQSDRKFQRETCALFLEWSENEAAKRIATSGLSHAEKIEQLGREMYGEAWDA